MKDDIKESSIELIALNIQKALAKDAFLMSRENPFLNWIRNEQVTACGPEELGLKFYIANPPVPPISPFDLATVFISFEPPSLGSILFQLTFHFRSVLSSCIELDEINVLYDKHDNIWFIKLSEYFAEIEDSFNLSWETEYDNSIEDNLYGRIPLEKAENITLIMAALKLRHEQWLQQEDKTNEPKR